MIGLTHGDRHIRFGEFELHTRTRELQKNGNKVGVQEQPFLVLMMLLERPGDLVTRNELIKQLWPADTFVDFEHGLNKAVKRLREVLSDSAETPRFIETLPRCGYRFIAPVTSSPAVPVVAMPGGVASLAILPLVNETGDAEIEYLSDGISASVINLLSRFPNLRVIPRTSAFRYRGTELDLEAIGRRLNVSTVLTGKLIRHGDRLVVQTDLVDVVSDAQIWGGQFNKKLEDIFEVQVELAHQISENLRVRLTPEDEKRFAKRPTQSREAFQLFLKAVYHANKWTPEGLRKGIEYFWRALDEDPAYPDPYAGLAYVYTMLGILGAMRPAEALSKARTAALKALERDDECGGAHAALGIVRLLYEWDWSGARRELERALRIEPNNPYFRLCHGVWLNAMGRSQDAIAEMTAALDLDPLSSFISHNLASVYLGADLEDQAIEQYLKTLELNPSFIASYGQLAGSYARKGMHDEAVELAEKYVALSGRDTRSRCFLSMVYANSGKREEATACMEDLKKDASFQGGLAFICASLGDREQAFEWLEKCYQERDAFLVFLPILPEFRNLHGDPRFADLLRRIGLPIKRDVDFKRAEL